MSAYDDIDLAIGKVISNFDEMYAAEERKLTVEIGHRRRTDGGAEYLPIRGTLYVENDGSMTVRMAKGITFVFTEDQWMEIVFKPTVIVFGVQYNNYMVVCEEQRPMATTTNKPSRLRALFKRN